MRVLILTVLLVLMVSPVYADESEKVISVQHDSIRGATCWILNDMAISCLPDSQLKRQPNVTQDHIKESPAPASAQTPRKTQEAYQL